MLETVFNRGSFHAGVAVGALFTVVAFGAGCYDGGAGPGVLDVTTDGAVDSTSDVQSPPETESTGDGRLPAALVGKDGACSGVSAQVDADSEVPCSGVDSCDFASGGTCKLKEGQACNADADCASGVCRSYFLDADQDGHGTPGSIVRRCGAVPAPPPGYAVMGDDCCDNDPDAHPGQTAYFVLPNACGTYDYNCDGQAFRERATCSLGTVTTAAPECGKACTIKVVNQYQFIYDQGCR